MRNIEATDYGTLLRSFAQELDVPPEVHERLNDEYRRIGAFIQEDSESRFRASAEVYPQGSKALGTMTKPVRGEDDFDFDAVYRRDIERGSASQAEFKASTGEQLKEYVRLRREHGIETLAIEDGRRCWTLHYDGFHIDVLPALPDSTARAAVCEGEPIWITDRRLGRWQPSNPRGFIDWFRKRMAIVLDEQRHDMAKSAGVSVRDIEDDQIKTPLQIAVQLLKRHRDEHFRGSEDDRPISIIITTLAARAYQNERDVHGALATIFRHGRNHIEKENSRLIVANPVDPSENFADKWQEYPERARAFLDWFAKADSDLGGSVMETRIDKVAKSLGAVLGEELTEGAVRRWGEQSRAARVSGTLRAAKATASLGATGPIRVPDHTFYGGAGED